MFWQIMLEGKWLSEQKKTLWMDKSKRICLSLLNFIKEWLKDIIFKGWTSVQQSTCQNDIFNFQADPTPQLNIKVKIWVEADFWARKRKWFSSEIWDCTVREQMTFTAHSDPNRCFQRCSMKTFKGCLLVFRISTLNPFRNIFWLFTLKECK